MSRFTVDLGPEFDRRLANLAEDRSTTKAEVIRRALIAYEVLKNEEKSGHTVSITGQVENGQQKILKDVLLP
jgi:predicted transcriptional regulator